MRLPGAGSALLFLDRNHNGRADNGSELFGLETGGAGVVRQIDVSTTSAAERPA